MKKIGKTAERVCELCLRLHKLDTVKIKTHNNEFKALYCSEKDECFQTHEQYQKLK